VNISVLLLTLNEEANLPACLSAVAWSDDIVVLDSYSSDNTVPLAEHLGARVYQRRFDSFAGQRNHALEAIDFKNNWILHLDADEIVTSELHAEMLCVIGDARYDAYRIPSKMMLFGKWLRYSGLYPSYQVRLGHRARFRFKQVGHGQREDIPAERVGTLSEPYLHYSFSKGLSEWFDKHNRYSSDEARTNLSRFTTHEPMDWAGLLSTEGVRRRRALKDLSGRLPFRPLLRFLYMYILRRGFLDGRAGLTYCSLLAIYEFMIVLKLRELREQAAESDRPAAAPEKS
jgi:glycosyltransferase involved in cell wall biosynthesis